MTATQAVGLRFFFPAGHVVLGDTLVALGRLDRAAQAYEVALTQRPSHTKARYALAELYREMGRDADLGRILAGGDATDGSGAAVIAQRPQDR